MKIVEDASLTDPVHTWQWCRSPSRAKRRKARGFKQRDGYIHVPKKIAYLIGDMVVMHPQTAQTFRSSL